MNNKLAEWLIVVAIILIVTWGLAKAVKFLVAKRVDKVPLFQRVAASGHSIGALLGRIVLLFIWICGLTVIAVVSFEAGGGPGHLPIPFQQFLNSFGSFLPKIVYATVSFVIGVIIAKIVRDIVATMLSTVKLDKWANLGGTDAVTSNSAISETISNIVFILLIVSIGIGALNVLDLPSFTDPVKNMLQIILNVFFGAVLIAAGVILARVLKGVVATTCGEGVAPALVNCLTIGLFMFIGIKQMNIGGQIVDYAFGAIAVGAAVALALAVGLGSREAIARKMNELLK
jgi:hypothetical protein